MSVFTDGIRFETILPDDFSIEMASSTNYSSRHCDYETSQSGTMKRHVKSIHLKVRDFQCNECENIFSEKNLDHHLKSVQLKVKDFQCSNCNKTFSQKSSMIVHMKSVHLKVRFSMQ